ncbi:MAG: penicillin-binding transpeptidase domain-containing protein [Patescibacteria group bacterium]
MLLLPFMRLWKRKTGPARRVAREIDPDEIFLDSRNLPQFNRHQFEGRFEQPIARRVIFAVGTVGTLILLLFLLKSAALQIEDGARYRRLSEENRLRHTLLFGERGIITDRRGEKLAWNAPPRNGGEFSERRYKDAPGLSHVMGYLSYPRKDRGGFYYQVDFEGVDGAEKHFNERLAPEHGLRIVETDALGAVRSESVLRRPEGGKSVALAIDARVQGALYGFMESLAKERGFTGGAAALMDAQTGELLALTSFPEYRSQTLTDGTDREGIERFRTSPKTPFLNRATEGLYTPGSIVKPFVAVAALEEGVITPEKTIYSSGSISVQNPFDPAKPTVFRDWKAHGAVSMKEALAVSSDVYFYAIGGGFEEQRGVGIQNIEKYLRLFGFGEEQGGSDFSSAVGVIPSPEWKREQFNGDAWRLGDTYHTAIGQYGLQVTPLEAVRAVAAIANGGTLLAPRLARDARALSRALALPLRASSLALVGEGMRDAVRFGTARALSLPFLTIAAKTGTAELGTSRRSVHSWAVGFFPYEKPRFAFAVVMEKGPRENTVGALFVMRELLEWMSVHTPEYLEATVTSNGNK